jgi:Protein of unknown function (DUF1264)
MDRREMMKVFGGAGMGMVLGGHAAHADHEKPAAGAEGPMHNPHVHFCGIHIAKKDPKIQIIAQHYCAGHSIDEHGETMFQCVLFDTAAKNAKLLGVEYVISDKIYRTLKDDEKKYWHPHTYEVLGGGLIAPGMKDEDERKFMNLILETWGKTWHTWPDHKTAVPIGEPLLIWSLTGDGQVDEKVLAKRDEEFKVSTADIRTRRAKEFGLEVPQIELPKSMDAVGRQWTKDGDDKKPARKN